MKQIKIIAVSLLLLSGLFTQAQTFSVSPTEVKITSVEDGVKQLKTLYEKASLDQLKVFITALYSKYSAKEIKAAAAKANIVCYAICGANYYNCNQPKYHPNGIITPPCTPCCDSQLESCRAACVSNN